MNIFSDLIPVQVMQALGYALFHSLWQGFAIALVLALLLLCMRQSSAAIRYFITTGAMATFAIITAITFINEYRSASAPAQTPSAEAPISQPPGTIDEAKEMYSTHLPANVDELTFHKMYTALQAYLLEHLPLIVLLWCMGICLLIIRFVGGFAYTQRLKYYKTVTLPGDWQRSLNALAKTAGISKPVKIAESVLVKVPMVVGYIKPVILLPLGTILALPAEQVEAILAHELAHIYRKDYLVNILQCMIEIIFFYHPAIWWISSRIREEREHCCDDIALNLCGNSLTIAKALTNLQHIPTYTPTLTLGFMGTGNRLLMRIQRLVHGPRQKPDFMEGFLAACFVILSITAISVSAGVRKNLPDALAAHKPHVAASQPQLYDTEIQAPADTTKNTFTFKGTRNGKKYDIKAVMQKGTIISLLVNGKKIPESEISNYYDLLYSVMESVPTPPSPASPPDIAEPSFPVQPALAPHVNIPDIVAQAPEDMHAILLPSEVRPTITITPPPLPPHPAVAPMTTGIIAEIIRAAFSNDTTHMQKGDFVYQFTGENNKTYKITIKDGVLTELKVDGKKIPKSDFSRYFYIIEELDKDITRKQRDMEARHNEILELQEHMENAHHDRVQELQMRLKAHEEMMRNYDDNIEKALKQHEMIKEQAHRKHEMAMQEHERAMAKHEESAKFSKEMISLLNNELIQDKLIQQNRSHYIRISPEGLYIDQVKQPKATFEKYKKLIENKTGKPMDFTIQYPFEAEK
jgi:beta-lactamase regulating signal transducer with metallopeptidase domain